LEWDQQRGPQAFVTLYSALERAQGQVEAFRALFQTAIAATGSVDIEALAGLVADRSRDILAAPHVQVTLHRWSLETGEITTIAATGSTLPEEVLKGFAQGLFGQCMATGMPLFLDSYPEWPGAMAGAINVGIMSGAGIPLMVGDEAVGMLAVHACAEPFVFDERVQEVLSLMGAFVGPALNAALLHSELARTSGELNGKNAELERASRHKSEFLANMSHELRTPLSAIIGFSELLLDGVDEDLSGSQREDVLQIHSSGKSLLNLINDILDLSKIEAGKMTMDQGPVAIGPMVDRVMVAVRPLAEAKDLEIVADFGTRPLVAWADELRTRQVLTNLVSNAIKFTSQGRITIHCRELEGVMEMSVVDTGIGISEDAQARIFDEFSQADGSTTRRFGGTGLGLAICRRLVNLQGGTLGVESTVGVGSRFWFTIPQMSSVPAEVLAAINPPSEADPDLPKAAAPRPARRSPLSGQTNDVVLVIDDEQSTRKVIVRRLEEAGFKTAEARGGPEALALARELHPAAITLDIQMPEMDGWTVLSALKHDKALADIPVVIVSVVEDREGAMSLGAFDCLTKPVDKDRLVNTLRSALPSIEGADVLCVDDEAPARELVARALSPSGITVRQASSAMECLRMVDEKIPDAILVDLMMPEMSGFELVARLRARRALSGVPIVVLSARVLSSEEVQMLEGGVTRFISKSDLQVSNLGPTVRQAIEHARVPAHASS
ncbi:MAG TPA: response regulator, partial [Candidatus Dormibacteraeota bacterium]|nr:response regulator [Candidatus Dormibacteraeota bacterium]